MYGCSNINKFHKTKVSYRWVLNIHVSIGSTGVKWVGSGEIGSADYWSVQH